MPPNRHDDLFGAIANFPALLAAARRAALGKRRKPGPAGFLANLEGELLRLERDLLARRYRPGRYVAFEVRDPKPRMVSAAPFRDRVVHHALCAVVEPIFERGFIFDSYANRLGKGTHRAISRYERFRDRAAYVLRCDIYRFFPAIDHAVLKADLRRRIACADTLWLLDTVIDASNPQEPVDRHFPGDDLLAPLIRRRGLPIGNLTSQFFANVHLDGLDHFCTEILRPTGFLRYVDDFALFHDDRAALEEMQHRLSRWLGQRRLLLHPRKTEILSTADPATFLGLDLHRDGRRRLPADTVQRFRRRLRSFRDRYAAGTINFEQIVPRVRSWVAHTAQADSWRLREAIFREAVYIRPRRPDYPGGASSAAALGTIIPGLSALPSATGTTPETGTTISASGWPARTQD